MGIVKNLFYPFRLAFLIDNEKMKNRENLLQRASNQQVRASVYKAVCNCNIFNRKANMHDLPALERYFKYQLN